VPPQARNAILQLSTFYADPSPQTPGGAENAGLKNAGPELKGPKMQGWKM